MSAAVANYQQMAPVTTFSVEELTHFDIVHIAIPDTGRACQFIPPLFVHIPFSRIRKVDFEVSRLKTEGDMDRTEHFRGRLWAGDQVLLEHVEGHLKTKLKPNSAHGEWTGHFEFPAEARDQFADGVRYRLTLIDGRSGHIHLLLKADVDGETPRASFHGTGSARR
jgi:hypothetical protein